MQTLRVERQTERIYDAAQDAGLRGVVELEFHPRKHLGVEADLSIDLDPVLLFIFAFIVVIERVG